MAACINGLAGKDEYAWYPPSAAIKGLDLERSAAEYAFLMDSSLRYRSSSSRMVMECLLVLPVNDYGTSWPLLHFPGIRSMAEALGLGLGWVARLANLAFPLVTVLTD